VAQGHRDHREAGAALKTAQGAPAACAARCVNQQQPSFPAPFPGDSGSTAAASRRSCAPCRWMAMRAGGNTSSRARVRPVTASAGRRASFTAEADLAAAGSKQQTGALSARIRSRTGEQPRHRRLLPPTAARGGSWACRPAPGRRRHRARAPPPGVRAALASSSPQDQLPGRQRHALIQSRREPLLPSQPRPAAAAAPSGRQQQHQAETEGIGDAAAATESRNPIRCWLRPSGAALAGARSSRPLLLLESMAQGLPFQVRWLGSDSAARLGASTRRRWPGRQSLKLRQLRSPPG